MAYSINPDYIPFAFPSGSKTASGLYLDGRQLAGIILNSGQTGTQLYFDIGTEAGNWYRLMSGGVPYSAKITADWNVIDPEQFLAVNYVRFRMSATAQTGNLSGTAVVRPF